MRAQLGRDRSTPSAKQIRDWAFAQHPIPQTDLAKAIAYMLGLWDGLTRFLENPRIPLDNNASERVLRGPGALRFWRRLKRLEDLNEDDRKAVKMIDALAERAGRRKAGWDGGAPFLFACDGVYLEIIMSDHAVEIPGLRFEL